MSDPQESRAPWLIRQGWWLGALFAVANLLAYFMVFVRWPNLRDMPWPSLLLGLVGLAWLVAGTWQAWKRGGWLRRLASTPFALLGLLATALLPFYVFVMSFQVPPPTTTTMALKNAPQFSLTDHEGQVRRLSDYRGKKVLIVFYRGWW